MAHNVNRDILVFKDMDEMSDVLVKRWSDIAEHKIKTKGYFTVALSGGKTPITLYGRLSDKKLLPWSKIHVFAVDERFVPYESDENNYHMINRTLLRHVTIPARNVHPILTSELSPEASALKYEEDLVSFFKPAQRSYPRFDLILLGAGRDGHTASLFPGSPSLRETRRLAVAVTPPEAAVERISLTLPVINNAENIIFLASGESKAKVLKEIIENKDCDLPAAMVISASGKVSFFLDESAAALLSER